MKNYTQALVLPALVLLLSACALPEVASQPQEPQQIVPQDFFGEFSGTYRCAQGETGVNLTFTRGSTPGVVEGVFEFYPTPENPRVPQGSFEMQGNELRNGMLVMEGVRWIDQPSGYGMVNIALKPEVQNGIIEGEVTGLGGCSWIRVRRQ